MFKRWSNDDGPGIRVYWWKEFFRTLFNHRQIIRDLHEEKRELQEDAKKATNLLFHEGMGMFIDVPRKSFMHTVMITNGKANGYIASGEIFPEYVLVENCVKKIKSFMKAEEKKINDKISAKRKTDYQKKQSDSNKDKKRKVLHNSK